MEMFHYKGNGVSMKKDKELKQKAALAGVMMFIEEEMARQQQAISSEHGQVQSAWGHYGRQSIMSNRGMMQMKFRKR